MFQSQFNKTKVQNQDACMTLDERLFDATRLCSFAQQHNQIIISKVKDVISQYLNHTDVPVAPPETAVQETPTAVHPNNTTMTTQQEKEGIIRQISVRNIDGAAGLWFNVWWVGFENPTAEPVAHLVNEGINPGDLRRIANKGLNARPTIWGGLSLRSGRETPTIGTSSAGPKNIDWVPPYEDFITDVNVKFQYEGARCVPYSFLNVCPDVSKNKKDMLMAELGMERCAVTDLCNPVGKVFKRSLQKVDEDLDWIISQTHGSFMVFETPHCVGVDCGRGLIFDSSMSKALRLCKNAFHHCNIIKPEDVRRII